MAVVAVVVVVVVVGAMSISGAGLFPSDSCGDCHPSVQSVHQYFCVQSPAFSLGQLESLAVVDPSGFCYVQHHLLLHPFFLQAPLASAERMCSPHAFRHLLIHLLHSSRSRSDPSLPPPLCTPRHALSILVLFPFALSLLRLYHSV